jgi:phosphate transport system ATP-binding protein
VLLLDEPCSALDPIATRRVEELMVELKKDYTIALVTHNMQQAIRVADTGLLLGGYFPGYAHRLPGGDGPYRADFRQPARTNDRDYISGKFS